jgi:hypothetical protein
MRRWIIILLTVLVPVVARANPYILDPSSLIAFDVVALWALIVETGIVALLLVFRGLSPLRMFCGYFLTNVTVFIFVFCPLRDHLTLPILEALVVPGAVCPRSPRTQQQGHSPRLCPQGTGQIAFVGKLRKTKRGRPHYSIDPAAAKIQKNGHSISMA